MLGMVELKSLISFSEKGDTWCFTQKRGVAHFHTRPPLSFPFSWLSFYFQKHPHTFSFTKIKTLIAIPHQTRPYQWTQTIRIGFKLCAEVYTLPTSPALRSHGQWDPNPKLFPSLHVLTLTIIPEGFRPPPCPNRTKHSPSLSSRCSPAIITLGFGPYKFRLSDCPYSLEWLYLSWVQVVKYDKPVLIWGDDLSCSHLTRLSQHLRPSPKPGSPWSSHSVGDKGEYPSSYTSLKTFLFRKNTIASTHVFVPKRYSLMQTITRLTMHRFQPVFQA
jgi:hypothetical protein